MIILNGTKDFTTTIPGSSVTDNSLTLPIGRYYITISAGLSNASSQYIYQILKIIQGDNVLLENYYFNQSTSSALFLELKESTTLNIQIIALDVRSNTSQNLSIADALPLVGPNKVWARINVLTLDVES